MRTRITMLALAVTAALVPASGALAAPGPGPSYDTIDALDGTYACGGHLVDGVMVSPPDEGAQVPPNHCMLVHGGNTGLILVLSPDDRGPSEGISGDPKVDDRPCPHDPASPDGTWWQPTTPDGTVLPFWVCHRRP